MKIFSSHRRKWAMAGALASVVIIIAGVLFLVSRDQSTTPGAAHPNAPVATSTKLAPMTPPRTGTMRVTVYFHQGPADDPARVVPVVRTVPQTKRVATAALTELLGGPTAAERAAGYWSQFSGATAGMLRGVRVHDHVAYVDFRDFSRIIPNASSSFGSAALLAELDTTLLRFPTITSTVYSFDGDVGAFYEWLQLSPPNDWASAVGTAQRFLTTVAGMNNPAAGPVRRTGNGTAEVTFQARSPDGTPMPAITTVVSLRRDVRWSVTGARTATILVHEPATGHSIHSPVRVSGQAHTFEGHVTVRVLAERGTTTAELGSGFVTGGGDQLRPFSGDIAFTEPNGGGAGWVLCTEESAADGSVIRVTATRIAFEPSSHEDREQSHR